MRGTSIVKFGAELCKFLGFRLPVATSADVLGERVGTNFLCNISKYRSER
jgi:hypothetical protein